MSNVHVGKKKMFAVAYRIFTSLSDEPLKSSDYAERLSVSVTAIKVVVSLLSKAGCISTQRGGGKNSGISRMKGVTIEDLFKKFDVPFQQGDSFEQEIDSLLLKKTERLRKCEVCSQKNSTVDANFLCAFCKSLDSPVFNTERLARCGHMSATRYFKCETCSPELEDNMTPDDWGCALNLS